MASTASQSLTFAGRVWPTLCDRAIISEVSASIKQLTRSEPVANFEFWLCDRLLIRIRGVNTFRSVPREATRFSGPPGCRVAMSYPCQPEECQIHVSGEAVLCPSGFNRTRETLLGETCRIAWRSHVCRLRRGPASLSLPAILSREGIRFAERAINRSMPAGVSGPGFESGSTGFAMARKNP